MPERRASPATEARQNDALELTKPGQLRSFAAQRGVMRSREAGRVRRGWRRGETRLQAPPVLAGRGACGGAGSLARSRAGTPAATGDANAAAVAPALPPAGAGPRGRAPAKGSTPPRRAPAASLAPPSCAGPQPRPKAAGWQHAAGCASGRPLRSGGLVPSCGSRGACQEAGRGRAGPPAGAGRLREARITTGCS